jgi:hypothetical protein
MSSTATKSFEINRATTIAKQATARARTASHHDASVGNSGSRTMAGIVRMQQLLAERD